MKYRRLAQTGQNVSEVGFGVWTLSTGWWGKYTEEEALAFLHRALDLGINFFDTADVYGYGYGEELLGKAFAKDQREVVIATKVGYDFTGSNRGHSQRELPHNFSERFLRQAVENSLRRLRRETIDNLQLHNIRMEHVVDDDIWELLEALRREGKIRSYGIALGPAIGWLYEGIEALRRRRPHVVQHIYNLLEPFPGRPLMDAAPDASPRFLVRVPHSSGLLEGKYTAATTFPKGDHRNHRPAHWLPNGLKKVEQLRFLERPGRTLGQAALQWILQEPRVLSCLPNIYTMDQLEEFAGASDAPPLSRAELERIDALIAANFGMEEPPEAYKGTMTPAMSA
ncbi:Predicted oxidoreductase [Methylacidimicrobium sp. AP8]|uniref:aldo/keto reductase n=1 Tax=Methylacidimicrobium sp. AP8 TaxID=2730359 RepID=UPI0018BF9943|nr:aldo/keto reductase [Methylacidimicrobium sp. AP8]CAB4244623.1 Predicted oxidoreductase [Methylacidimicrobium sp. AP8]